MKKKVNRFLGAGLAALLMTTSLSGMMPKSASAATTPVFASVGGYNETIYAQISGIADANVTGVSYSGPTSGTLTGEDFQYLVRDNNGGVRIDIPGLKAGTYSLTVNTTDGNVTQSGIVVDAQDRSGYAHFNYTDGVGAYNDDGTLKQNAIVLYVTNENKESVTVKAKDGTTVTGIGNILNSAGSKPKTDSSGKVLSTVINTNQDIICKLAQDGTPLVVRFIGSVKAPQGLTAFNSNDCGGTKGDNGFMARMQSGKDITLEGIGYDAVIDGWGFHFIAQESHPEFGKSFEVKNLSFRNVPEDCVGMEGVRSGSTLSAPVERCWVHNCAFYVPKISNPAESDKGEGDGACDFKRGQYFTNSYCYYSGYHKTNLVGAGVEDPQFHLTFHHNYWQNCESRGPLTRQANVHMYNNVFENQSSYAMNTRAEAYIFSEYNLFYMVSAPMKVEVEKNREGGPIKSYHDSFSSCISSMNGTIVEDKNMKVSSSNKYANFDTDSLLSYIPQGNYQLQESVTEARKVIYAKTGVMKENPIAVEQVTSAMISYVPANVTPTKVSSFPATLVSGSEKFNKTVKAFTADKAIDVTVQYSSEELDATGVLVNEAGEAFLIGSGTVHGLPAGTYMIQSMNMQPGANASFKEVTITSLVIEENDPTIHWHQYALTEQVEATCATDGSKTYVCKADGDCDKKTYVEVIPAAHQYSVEWTVDAQPTATEVGSKSHHCIKCGDRADATEIPAGTQNVTGNEYVHNFSVSETASTVYTIQGSIKTNRGRQEYGEYILDKCLEMGGPISFTAPSKGELKLVFGGSKSASGKKVVVNGTRYTCDENGILNLTLEAGPVEITKGDAICLFYMNFEPESRPATTYDVIVEIDGNGTASAETAKAAGRTNVKLTAVPEKGYKLKEWQVVSGEATVVDNSFTMPASAVTIKAVFEEGKEEPDETGETLILDVSNMTAAEYEENTVASGYLILATADSSVVVDGNSKSLNGKNFTQRLKLGGVGSIEKRSVKVTTAGASKITAYVISSSNDAVRKLVLLDENGKIVDTKENIGGTIQEVVFDVTKAGSYYIASESGGINLYYLETTNAIPEKESEAPKSYSVTVQNDGNGTASSSAASAAEGIKITLSATAKEGYIFKEWIVVSGGVTISGNEFTMPAADVTIKAVFEKKAETPEDPTDPTNPTDPTTPTDPTDPTNPTTPTDPTDPTEGNIKDEVQVGIGAPKVEIDTTVDKLADMVLTESERQALSRGENVILSLLVENADGSVSENTKKVIADVLGSYKVGQYLDISMIVRVGNSQRAVTQTAQKLELTIQVPEVLKNTDNKIKRSYAVVRVHDGEAKVLTDMDEAEATITIQTDRFSTYAIVYRDVAVEGDEGDDAPNTGDRNPLGMLMLLIVLSGVSYLMLCFAVKHHKEET